MTLLALIWIGEPNDQAEIIRPEPAIRAERTAIPRNTIWESLAQCESSGDWQSTVGIYEGGLQFHPRTWDSTKPDSYPDAAYQATPQQQIHVAEIVLRKQGWKAWPSCSRKVGLR